MEQHKREDFLRVVHDVAQGASFDLLQKYNRDFLEYAEKLRGAPYMMAIPQNSGDALRHAQHHLGRDQGTEQFYVGTTAITQGSLTTITIPKPFNINRPLRKIRIDLITALTTATGGFTSTNVDAPASLLQNARVVGTHAQFGVLTPVNISGRAIWLRGLTRRKQSNNFYTTLGTTAEPGFPLGIIKGFVSTQGTGNAGGRVRLAWFDGGHSPTVATQAGGGATLSPLESPLGGASGPLQAGINSYLIEDRFTIDLAPLIGPWSRTTKLPFSWRPEDWADTLQLTLQLGDANALGAIATANVPAGNMNMQYNIYFVYDLLGKDYIPKISPAVTIQGEQALMVPSAGSNNFRLSALQKKKTTDVILFTGQLSKYATVGPNVVFADMDDSALDVTQVVVDNKPAHNNLNNLAYKDHIMEQYEVQLPQGVFMIDFMSSQNPLSAYPGQNVAGGAAFELTTNAPDPGNLLGTNYALYMIQDWFVGDPKIS